MTGGRLRRVANYVDDDEAFCFTYGDGVSDVDIAQTVGLPQGARKAGHRYGGLSTGPIWRAGYPGRPSTIFKEKPKGDGALINAGFFVLSPKVLANSQ